MIISQKNTPHISIITIEVAELNSETCSHLKHEIAPILEQSNSAIALNMEKVIFIDSMGLGTILSIRNNVIQNKGIFSLFNLNSQLKKIITITALDKELCIFNDEKSAVAKINDLLKT